MEVLKSTQLQTEIPPQKVRKIELSEQKNKIPEPQNSQDKPSKTESVSSSGISQQQKQLELKLVESNSEDPQDKRSSTTSTSSSTSKNENLEKAMHQLLPVVLPKGQMAQKLKNASPYNLFFTTVTAAPETHSHPLSVTFLELLDPSLGELESSVQFNFMVDIAWLLAQYAFAKCSQQPLLILYGQDSPGLSDINKKRPNVTSVKVNIPTPFGVHHTKMMLLFYKDRTMRIVVSTANLYEDDWDNRTQGLWISDAIPALPEGVSFTNRGESVSSFRQDLLRYLAHYNIPKLQPVVAKIREYDFSAIKVFFVSSVPGSHRDPGSGKGFLYGHPRVSTLLSEHSAPIDESTPIILQASSIGSLGPSPGAYLTGEIASSFKRDSAPLGLKRVPSVKLIYPSLNNVLSSHDGMAGGGCLPYDAKTHEKQQWLNEHLHQWKASSVNRTGAMPHIKSYCRYSDQGLYWFILTSANVSRAAWGALNKSNKALNTLRINSYEAGVAFLPRVMIKKERFPMTENQREESAPIFKLPFDVPPVPYTKNDVPYCAEYLKAYLLKYGAK